MCSTIQVPAVVSTVVRRPRSPRVLTVNVEGACVSMCSSGDPELRCGQTIVSDHSGAAIKVGSTTRTVASPRISNWWRVRSGSSPNSATSPPSLPKSPGLKMADEWSDGDLDSVHPTKGRRRGGS